MRDLFQLCVDVNEHELAHVEAIHLLEKVLDHYCHLCELDLVFSFPPRLSHHMDELRLG